MKLPIIPFKKILKANGAKRVSYSASKAMAEIIQEISKALAKNAIIMAEHSGRKTVTRKDIEIARKMSLH